MEDGSGASCEKGKDGLHCASAGCPSVEPFQNPVTGLSGCMKTPAWAKFLSHFVIESNRRKIKRAGLAGPDLY